MYVCMYVCDLPIASPIPYDCHVDDELEAIREHTNEYTASVCNSLFSTGSVLQETSTEYNGGFQTHDVGHRKNSCEEISMGSRVKGFGTHVAVTGRKQTLRLI